MNKIIKHNETTFESIKHIGVKIEFTDNGRKAADAIMNVIKSIYR